MPNNTKKRKLIHETLSEKKRRPTTHFKREPLKRILKSDERQPYSMHDLFMGMVDKHCKSRYEDVFDVWLTFKNELGNPWSEHKALASCIPCVDAIHFVEKASRGREANRLFDNPFLLFTQLELIRKSKAYKWAEGHEKVVKDFAKKFIINGGECIGKDNHYHDDNEIPFIKSVEDRRKAICMVFYKNKKYRAKGVPSAFAYQCNDSVDTEPEDERYL